MGKRKRIDKVSAAKEGLLGDRYKFFLSNHNQRINFKIV
jgi:hypothetical protein